MGDGSSGVERNALQLPLGEESSDGHGGTCFSLVLVQLGRRLPADVPAGELSHSGAVHQGYAGWPAWRLAHRLLHHNRTLATAAQPPAMAHSCVGDQVAGDERDLWQRTGVERSLQGGDSRRHSLRLRHKRVVVRPAAVRRRGGELVVVLHAVQHHRLLLPSPSAAFDPSVHYVDYDTVSGL